MLARQREPEGAELVSESESQGSGEEPGSSREEPSGAVLIKGFPAAKLVATIEGLLSQEEKGGAYAE